MTTIAQRAVLQITKKRDLEMVNKDISVEIAKEIGHRAKLSNINMPMT